MASSERAATGPTRTRPGSQSGGLKAHQPNLQVFVVALTDAYLV